MLIDSITKTKAPKQTLAFAAVDDIRLNIVEFVSRSAHADVRFTRNRDTPLLLRVSIKTATYVIDRSWIYIGIRKGGSGCYARFNPTRTQVGSVGGSALSLDLCATVLLSH